MKNKKILAIIIASKLLTFYVLYKVMVVTISQYMHPFLQKTWVGENQIFTRISGVALYIVLNIVLLLVLRKKNAHSPEEKSYSVKQLVGIFTLAYLICEAIKVITEVVAIEILGQGNMLLDSQDSFYITMVKIGLVPIMEELVFRKALCDRLLPYGKKMAAVVSGTFFGAFHENVFLFPYASVAGTIFAMVYLDTGKVKYAIWLHMMFNVVNVFFG